MLKELQLIEYHPDTAAAYRHVIKGLLKPVKELPPKLFYDERGSQLFDQITRQPEYYPTRIEQKIMDQYIDAIAARIGPDSLLIEYGSGSSQKTRTLLDHLPRLAGYVPIDISREHLMQSAARLATAYPYLDILPVWADYETDFTLPRPNRPVRHKVIYYPGSTLGNFHPEDAVAFLWHMRAVCGYDCDLLLGVDLKKDATLLNLAYNDCAGVTADFNLNMLAHLNRELGADFNLNQFRHHAFYNEEAGRIEMHLVSLARQTVHLIGHAIPFETGETIWTESSYKYTPTELAALAGRAGLAVEKVWTDPNRLFSVQYLTSRNA